MKNKTAYMTPRFNIRVYGLIFNPETDKDILLSDEFRMNRKMTKFPGGGLQYGEGTIDCLKREALEEFGQDIAVVKHLYTTDFFQPADFFHQQQLISIYYQAQFQNPIHFTISELPFDFPQLVEGAQSFRWKSVKDLQPHDLSFPIDQKVAGMIKDIKS